MAVLTAQDEVRQALAPVRVVAVLGAHSQPHRAAFYVPDYLHAQGYRVLPINPRLRGQTLWGQPVLGNLADLAEPVDMINVFRNSRWLSSHVPEILQMSPLPGLVWCQQGVRDDDVAAALADAGIDVVQDWCLMVAHKLFGLGPPPSSYDGA